MLQNICSQIDSLADTSAASGSTTAGLIRAETAYLRERFPEVRRRHPLGLLIGSG